MKQLPNKIEGNNLVANTINDLIDVVTEQREEIDELGDKVERIAANYLLMVARAGGELTDKEVKLVASAMAGTRKFNRDIGVWAGAEPSSPPVMNAKNVFDYPKEDKPQEPINKKTNPFPYTVVTDKDTTLREDILDTIHKPESGEHKCIWRFEVIDYTKPVEEGGGRTVMVNPGSDIPVTYELQDGGTTLKVFMGEPKI